jgi:hypothetical protein
MAAQINPQFAEIGNVRADVAAHLSLSMAMFGC